MIKVAECWHNNIKTKGRSCWVKKYNQSISLILVTLAFTLAQASPKFCENLFTPFWIILHTDTQINWTHITFLKVVICLHDIMVHWYKVILIFHCFMFILRDHFYYLLLHNFIVIVTNTITIVDVVVVHLLFHYFAVIFYYERI